MSFILLFATGYAAEIKNLTSGQSGERGFVQYDLVGKLGEKEADVTVFAEIGGERYPAGKLSLSGDFGANVNIGKGKRFYWDFLKDFPAGFDGEVSWDVEASGAPVATAPPATAQTVAKSGRLQESPLRDLTTGMEFVSVPAGCFSVKDTQVCVDAFRLGKYEVTQGQYQKIMGTNPSYFSSCGEDCPVEQVRWDDAQAFISRLNNQSGRRYRLPTEAEWHYACTSGGKSEEYCGGNNVDTVAWYKGNSGSKTHPVGQKQPNGLGLHDMSGNVGEWVQDWYGDKYPSSQRNPTGPSSGNHHLARGGSWRYNVSASYRSGINVPNRGGPIGFRLVFPVQ
jgi:formylglycine-generating enzyme required for sulfatase activity